MVDAEYMIDDCWLRERERVKQSTLMLCCGNSGEPCCENSSESCVVAVTVAFFFFEEGNGFELRSGLRLQRSYFGSTAHTHSAFGTVNIFTRFSILLSINTVSHSFSFSYTFIILSIPKL